MSKLEGLGKGQEAQGGSSPCEAYTQEHWSVGHENDDELAQE